MPDLAKILNLDQRRGPRAGGAKQNLIEAIVFPAVSGGIMVLCGLPVLLVFPSVVLGMLVGLVISPRRGWIVLPVLGVFIVGSGALWGRTLPWMIPAVIFAIGGGSCLWNYSAAAHTAKTKQTRASARLARGVQP